MFSFPFVDDQELPVQDFDYIPILLPKSAEDWSLTFDRIATGRPFYFAHVPAIDCLRNPGLSNTQRYCAGFRPVL